MKTSRLEAFTDGILAIIITIMVLELKVPEGSDFYSLLPLYPKFISYFLSFIYLGIYWNNHHHLFQAISKVNGIILWANLLLLFSLSLIPFTTAWMGENHFENKPVVLYGINLLTSMLSFFLLEKTAMKYEGNKSVLNVALSDRKKEYLSFIVYLISTVLAFFQPVLGLLGYFAIAVLWFIPDKRIEKSLLK